MKTLKQISSKYDLGLAFDILTGIIAVGMLFMTVTLEGSVTEALAWVLCVALSVRLIRGN